MDIPQGQDLRSREDLAKALKDSYQAFTDAADGLSDTAFFLRPSPERWSAGEQTLHLIRSVKAVGSGLGYPKLMLLVLFGGAKTSRSLEEVVEDYRQHLGRGGKASGRYVPELNVPVDPETEELVRQRLMKSWQKAGTSLNAALDRWSETDLDRRRLPHPLIGKLTVREMLFFTVYHNHHHAESVRGLSA